MILIMNKSENLSMVYF